MSDAIAIEQAAYQISASKVLETSSKETLETS